MDYVSAISGLVGAIAGCVITYIFARKQTKREFLLNAYAAVIAGYLDYLRSKDQIPILSAIEAVSFLATEKVLAPLRTLKKGILSQDEEVYIPAYSEFSSAARTDVNKSWRLRRKKAGKNHQPKN